MLWLPTTALIANCVKPALVYVDEPALAFEELEEDEGTLLSQVEAPEGVRLRSQPDNLLVAEPCLVSHDISDVMLFELLAVDLRELPHNLLDRQDLFPSLHLVLNKVHQLEVLQLSLSPLRD